MSLKDSYRCKDKQGIVRGQCTQCSCVSYNSQNGLLCAKCRHPPTKHEKVGTGDNATSTSPPKPSPSVASTPSMNYAEATAAHHVQSDQYNSVASHNYQAEWPKCIASGCLRPVHYQKEFDFFKYCSPKCRDDHLLPDYNMKLDAEIDNYRYLQTAVSRGQTSPRAARGDSSSNEVTVTVKLQPKEPFGFILNKHGSRMVVVGTKTEGALKLIREQKIHLLDTIVSINEQRFSEPSKVAEYADPKTLLSFVINRTHSLSRNMQSFFIEGTETNTVICLRSSSSCGDGFDIDKKLNVTSVHQGSEADRCGLKRGDKIVVYASADNKAVHKVVRATKKSQFEQDILKSHFCFIIGIHRRIIL